jgi:protein O-mannosyl-transferase
MSNKKQGQAKQVQPSANKNSTINKLPLTNNYLLWLAAILLLTIIAFTPALKNGFTNWDDNRYIAENPLITNLSFANIKNIFSINHPVALNYHPITILSFAIDYHLSDYSPARYHTTNLIIHLLNTALVFWFIFLLSGKKIEVASIVALFFGIHPMHVESVAWISERKDVLYVFFFLSSIICYFKYRSAQSGKEILLYMLTLTLFLLSILSKAMAVVLPLVFLLIDYYEGRKFEKKSILEKIPFFILSLIFGIIATRIQSQGGAIIENYNLFQRFEFAAYGMLNYIYHLFIPTNLSCFYPYPDVKNAPMPVIFHISIILVLGLFTSILWKFRNNKTLVFGFLFFVVTIALVLQFISVGKVIMADRYSYLAYIGLLFPIGMGYYRLQLQTDEKYQLLKKLSIPIILLFAAICLLLTYQRTKIWKNSDTLWTDAIQKYPNSDAYHSRASYLVNKNAIDIGQKNSIKNEYDRALADFNNSIKLNPNNADVFTGRANIYSLKDEFNLALSDYTKSIELDNKNANTYFNRAGAYNLMKQYDKAIEDYNAALLLNPNLISAKENRSRIYSTIGKYNNAIIDLNELIQLTPNNADYYFYRSFAFVKTNNYTAALADNTISLQLNPNNAIAYLSRSYIYRYLGELNNALNDALKAQNMGYPVDTNYIQELSR